MSRIVLSDVSNRPSLSGSVKNSDMNSWPACSSAGPIPTNKTSSDKKLYVASCMPDPSRGIFPSGNCAAISLNFSRVRFLVLPSDSNDVLVKSISPN